MELGPRACAQPTPVGNGVVGSGRIESRLIGDESFCSSHPQVPRPETVLALRVADAKRCHPENKLRQLGASWFVPVRGGKQLRIRRLHYEHSPRQG